MKIGDNTTVHHQLYLKAMGAQGSRKQKAQLLLSSREEKAQLLASAVKCNDVAAVKERVKAGELIIKSLTKAQQFLLMKTALRENHCKTLQFLVKAGVDVNVPSKKGVTAAMLAASKGLDSCLQILIQAGCDLNLEDEKGCPALYYAARKEHPPCGKMILDSGYCLISRRIQDLPRFCHRPLVRLLLLIWQRRRHSSDEDEWPVVKELRMLQSAIPRIIAQNHVKLLCDAGADCS